MIRATGGVWVNYATTLAFQVLLASRYGTSKSATAFALCFTASVALVSVVVSSSQSLILPRLLDVSGAIVTSALRVMLALVAVAAVVVGVVLIAAPFFAGLLAGRTGISSAELSTPLRFAALLAISQVVAGQLIALSIARGRRFAPAVAPVFPSLVGIGLLADDASPALTAVFIALLVGTLLEIAFLIVLECRDLRVVAHKGEPIAAATVMTFAQYVLLSLLPPFEVVMASLHSTSGGAEYTYAIRGLAVAQQLIVGGLVMASIGHWSALSRREESGRLTTSLARRLVVGMMSIGLAVAIGTVAATQIVAIVYERGSFTHAATVRVAMVLLVGLAGFGAESMSLILSQSLLAERRNRVAISFGLSRFALRASLVVVLAHAYGVLGVALAYSLASVAILIAQLGVIVPQRDWALVRERGFLAGAAAAGIVIVAGIVIAKSGGSLSAGVRIALVLAVFAACLASLRSAIGSSFYRAVRES